MICLIEMSKNCRRDVKRRRTCLKLLCMYILAVSLSEIIFGCFYKAANAHFPGNKTGPRQSPVSTCISCDKRNRVKFSVGNHTEAKAVYVNASKRWKNNTDTPISSYPSHESKRKSGGWLKAVGFS